MNETDKQLAEILKKGLEIAEKTGNFIVEQAPDLIQQLLIWKTVQHSLTFIVGVVLTVAMYRVFKKIYNDKKSDDYDYFDGIWESPFTWFGLITGLLITICCLSDFYNLIQIVFAPKIYLIEYSAKLLGG